MCQYVLSLQRQSQGKLPAFTRISINDFSSYALLSIKRAPQAFPNTGIPLLDFNNTSSTDEKVKATEQNSPFLGGIGISDHTPKYSCNTNSMNRLEL